MWVKLAELAGGWLLRRRALRKLAAGEGSFSPEEAEALRVYAASRSWTDEYLLLWWTGLATYAAFGAPWGGSAKDIQVLLNDPVILTFIGAVFGVRKFLR